MEGELVKFQTFSTQQRIHDAVALPKNPRLWTEQEVVEVFKRTGKHVLTFLGFGELGYEDEPELLRITARELAHCDPNRTIVNTGTLITVGFRRGIVDVYAS